MEKLRVLFSEKDLLRPLYDGTVSTEDSISLVCSNHFIEIDGQELISQVTDKLSKKRPLL